MQVRLGDVRDWPFIYSLSKSVIPVSISPWRRQQMEETISYRDKILKSFWTWIQQSESKVFITETEDTDEKIIPVGYLVLFPSSREELTGITQGWIMDVAVLPEYRGQGAGKMLIQAAEKYCRDRKILYLGLAVSSHNQNALKLYQQLGFAEERKLMVKVLD
ncbi:MAG: GNAT family N-acetyltransferase [Desulfitobacterium hafniense]|nr:GNAT family N-acetyltransferase [Desulfitobacterium hafniense]